jgi:hypothetical protein
LGNIPVSETEPVIQRIQTWLQPDLEAHLVDMLLSRGLSFLRNEDHMTLLQLSRDWLEGSSTFTQHLGLRCLLPLIDDPKFENLPLLFRLILPFCKVTPASLRQDLLDVLEALAYCSPKETAFFLRHTLSSPNSPDIPWLIRQCIDWFPQEDQEGLRDALRPQPE